MTEVATTPTPQQRTGGASIVMYRVGGREYPLRTVPGCKVCQSPHRFDIEQEIAAGRTYANIESSLLTLDPDCDVNRRNIADHYKRNHMPLEHEATRRILEHRAEEMGRAIEDGAETLVDGISAAKVVIQKSFEAIQRGELKPDIKDMLLAARIVETFGGGEEGPDAGAYVEAFMVYHEVASQFMDAATFEAFGLALSRNPVLKALVAKHGGEAADEPEGEDDDTIEAEVVDEPEQPDLESSTGILDNGESVGQDTSISKPTRQRKRKP